MKLAVTSFKFFYISLKNMRLSLITKNKEINHRNINQNFELREYNLSIKQQQKSSIAFLLIKIFG